MLAWEKDEFVGQRGGIDSQTGILRCSAEAAVEALQEAVTENMNLDILGVKSIKAFDALVIVVSMTANIEGNVQRLVGSCIIDKDPARGAALAVLNATNRVVGNLISTR